MKVSNRYLLNVLLFLLLTLILAGAQTTVWFLFFGASPAPALWMIVMTYLAIYRRPIEGLVVCYILGLFIGAFTAMPTGILIFEILISFLFLSALKRRIFWNSPFYFLIVTAIASLTFQLSEVVLMIAIDRNPISYFHWARRLEQMILTPFFAWPLYWVLVRLDRMTLDDVDARGSMP